MNIQRQRWVLLTYYTPGCVVPPYPGLRHGALVLKSSTTPWSVLTKFPISQITVLLQMFTMRARWTDAKAGRRSALRAEVFLRLDFLVLFHQGKRTRKSNEGKKYPKHQILPRRTYYPNYQNKHPIPLRWFDLFFKSTYSASAVFPAHFYPELPPGVTPRRTSIDKFDHSVVIYSLFPPFRFLQIILYPHIFCTRLQKTIFFEN